MAAGIGAYEFFRLTILRHFVSTQLVFLPGSIFTQVTLEHFLTITVALVPMRFEFAAAVGLKLAQTTFVQSCLCVSGIYVNF